MMAYNLADKGAASKGKLEYSSKQANCVNPLGEKS
jgi:hypothetical protein